MKRLDDVLLETHGDRDINFKDVRSAMFIYKDQYVDELYPLIFRGKQLEIWNALTFKIKSTGDLATELSMPSKNVSTQLNQMFATGLITMYTYGNKKTWCKRSNRANQ